MITKSIPRILLFTMAICALAVLTGCGTGPHPADNLLIHAGRLLKAGKFGQAQIEIDKAISIDPRRLESYLTAFDICCTEEQYGHAGRIGVAFLDAAAGGRLAEKVPDDDILSVCPRIGDACIRSKNWYGGEAAFKLCLKIKPDAPEMLNGLGYLYADAGINLKEAVDLINRALKQQPNDGAILDSLAWAEYRLGDYKTALVTIKKAMANYSGDDATLRYHLGAIYAKLGCKGEAKIELHKSVILDASLKDSKALLLSLQKSDI